MRNNREYPGGPEVRTQHFHGRGLGLIPGQETKISQAAQCSPKTKKQKKERKKKKRLETTGIELPLFYITDIYKH